MHIYFTSMNFLNYSTFLLPETCFLPTTTATMLVASWSHHILLCNFNSFLCYCKNANFQYMHQWKGLVTVLVLILFFAWNVTNNV